MRSARGALADPRLRAAARWTAFLVGSWIVLWPALTITISGDDLLNPFYVFADYGPSPFGMWRSVSRDLTRQGHFNHIGQNVGAVVFVGWAYLLAWGVRFSLVYAVTKFVVFVVAALVAARLLRTLAGAAGREVDPWRSRALVGVGLFTTLQIHVAWSSDPVASFPLSGYLAAAIGMWALDVAVAAVLRGDDRRLVLAAALLCVAILYYEINVAVVVALVPVAVLRLRAVRGTERVAPELRRLAIVVGPPAVMTVVLQAVASRANRGYTGTDVGIGDGTGIVAVRTVLGSLPASAWGVARDWLGEPVRASIGAIVVAGLTAAVLVVLGRRAPERSSSPDRAAVAIVATVPVVMWLVATAVQATTAKVRAETPRVGHVYNYYAYGSIGVVLAVLLLAPLVPRREALRWARVVAAVAFVGFVAVQSAVNRSVQGEFDERLAASDAVIVAFSERAPEPARCAALEAWASLPFWQPYYRTDLVEDVNATYEHFHDEPFCSTLRTA